MTKQRILIVDDEPDICDILKFNLSLAGFEAEVRHSAESAMLGGLSGYDLILLDVMMEGISGFQLAELMRQNPSTKSIPIIFITALDAEDDKLKGFDLGADDYISKPFSVKEVLSRVRAVLRRSCGSAPQESPNDSICLKYNSLELDTLKKTVTVDGKDAELTKTEFLILKMLMEKPGTVYSREDILKNAWPDEVVVLGRTVDVNITRLRRKIGEYGSCIVTKHGYGYCFDA